jgi:hypothetical protein
MNTLFIAKIIHDNKSKNSLGPNQGFCQDKHKGLKLVAFAQDRYLKSLSFEAEATP